MLRDVKLVSSVDAHIYRNYQQPFYTR